MRGKSSAILRGKCPRCRQGDIFKTKASDLLGFMKMHDQCAVCSLRFELEPGFYYGAMYISYAFNVALLVAIGVALSVLFDPPVWIYLVSVSVASLLLLPLSFRYSKILFLYWFGGIDFDSKYSN